MNEEPETFQELRQMIEDSRKITVQVLLNDGLAEREVPDGLGNTFVSRGESECITIEVSKTYALSLYKGSKGQYLAYDNAAHYDTEYKILYLN